MTRRAKLARFLQTRGPGLVALAGLALLSFGCFLLSPPVACIILGGGLLADAYLGTLRRK